MRTLFVLFTFFIATVVHAQADITEPVSAALAKGDAAAIGKYLVPSVDLTILDDEDMYPRDQVVKKLQQFFQKNPARGFVVKHRGTSKLDDHYRIGDLTTDSGAYRVTFFMKKGSSSMEIKQLRIERYD